MRRAPRREEVCRDGVRRRGVTSLARVADRRGAMVRETTRRPGTRRPGFALPVVLLLVALLSMLAAGAITIAGSEQRAVGNHALTARAHALARSGLDRFLAARDSLGFTSVPPAPVESVRVMLPGGFADVVLEEVRAEQGITTPAMYVVRSRGVVLDRASQMRPVAERTIAQYARWQRPSLPVVAAWASLSGVEQGGSAGAFSGVDACAAATTVAGVATPAVPGYLATPGPGVAVGSPNELDLGAFPAAGDALMLDWAAVRSQGIPVANVQLPGGTWPSGTQWGDPAFWPIIVANGDLAVPTDGRGLLVVTGDLLLPPGRVWEGVILVGERMQALGGATVSGVLMTGLNRKLGLPLGAPDRVGGTTVVQFNSCHVARAMAAFGGLAPLRNATVDRWAY